jgi:hypothetical protein
MYKQVVARFGKPLIEEIRAETQKAGKQEECATASHGLETPRVPCQESACGTNPMGSGRFRPPVIPSMEADCCLKPDRQQFDQ